MSQLFNIYVLNMSHTFHSQVLQATRAVLRTPAAAGRLAQTPAVLPRRGGRAAVDQRAQATCRFPRLWQEPHRSAEPAEETSGRQTYHFSQKKHQVGRHIISRRRNIRYCRQVVYHFSQFYITLLLFTLPYFSLFNLSFSLCFPHPSLT